MSGLYIHVPFCHSKCAYCDFYSLPRRGEFEDRYIDAIATEAKLRRNEIFIPETVYIGGGTPSILSSASFNKLASVIDGMVHGGDIAEFTIEVNPEDVTEDNASMWRAAGVNRISMGIQSLSNDELSAVGRRHSAEDALSAMQILQKYFSNISVDVIIGLPHQTFDTLSATLRGVLAYKPQHISAYILSYEEGTRLWSMRKTGKIRETDDETVSRMYRLVCDTLRDAGYEHYEISNYCLPGYKSRHNSNYWSGIPYLGLGPGAHSLGKDGLRRYNPDDIRQWLEATEDNRSAIYAEPENEVEKLNDFIMVRLRTAEGLRLIDIPEKFRAGFSQRMLSLPKGRVAFDGERIFIPETEWLVSDDTISRLFAD